jgi:hypothetical protein
LSGCGDKAATGGAGTFASTLAFASATITWHNGTTSTLTGAPTLGGTCGKGGAGTEATVTGSVTAGTLAGDTFSATACAVKNKAGTALTVTLVKGTGGFAI